ncbi:DUF3040 domain-containing protein [Streptomyces sp. NPDC020917]|uniref:DUF3040 domain-containing protein n=1 Tax=Streptomyces sp. NPDC020917 TaxID=3365102 RepID=UPI0037B97BDA
MSLSVRERRVLADIEQTLAEDDPRLARQMRQMRLSPAAGEPAPPRPPARPAPPEQQPAAGLGPPAEAAPAPYPDERPGKGARRVSRCCTALALVLLVASVMAGSTGVLLAAGAVAVVSCAAAVAARRAGARDPGARGPGPG